jgi:DNA-binding Xre family transcriptional regulator
MGVRYNNLFKMLIDKKMKKGELCKAAGISPSVLRKMSKGENVNVDIVAKICKALDCNLQDVMELVPDDGK